ncbi:MAG: alpha/beta hydrolase [Microthrixaceae bacterium]|nr:alpha/beta hydrolase [Microthrixaceae bacterium]
MGWVCLAVSVNGAIYTINALRPARRSRLFVGWSFFASWLTIELAPFQIIWQALATLFFVRRGALRSPQGRLGVGINVLSLAGLAITVRQSFAARDQVRDALADLEDAPAGANDATLPHIPGATEVSWQRRIEFARVGGRALRMDVLAPSEPPAHGSKRPLLIQVHGGGWVLGHKERQGQLVMSEMARAGWVCANVDYRLSPAATFPDHLVDVKRAIAWLRDNAERFGIDPGFVALTGQSAGGHLTALAALTQNDPVYQPGFEDADTSVQAAVPLYGVYDLTDRFGHWVEGTVDNFLVPWVMKSHPDEDPEAWAAASPMDRVHPGAPPMLVIHGDKDSLAPVEDARHFADELSAVSENPVHYLELAGAQHAFEIFPSIRANAVTQGIEKFLCATHRAHVHRNGVNTT